MPLKIDMIKEAIYETIKKEKNDQSDEKCKELVEETIQLMENKRPTTVRTNLKRTFNRGDESSKVSKSSKNKKK
jgi:methylthioribose-1-phosphate isomerase